MPQYKLKSAGKGGYGQRINQDRRAPVKLQTAKNARLSSQPLRRVQNQPSTSSNGDDGKILSLAELKERARLRTEKEAPQPSVENSAAEVEDNPPAKKRFRIDRQRDPTIAPSSFEGLQSSISDNNIATTLSKSQADVLSVNRHPSEGIESPNQNPESEKSNKPLGISFKGRATARGKAPDSPTIINKLQPNSPVSPRRNPASPREKIGPKKSGIKEGGPRNSTIQRHVKDEGANATRIRGRATSSLPKDAPKNGSQTIDFVKRNVALAFVPKKRLRSEESSQNVSTEEPQSLVKHNDCNNAAPMTVEAKIHPSRLAAMSKTTKNMTAAPQQTASPSETDKTVVAPQTDSVVPMEGFKPLKSRTPLPPQEDLIADKLQRNAKNTSRESRVDTQHREENSISRSAPVRSRSPSRTIERRSEEQSRPLPVRTRSKSPTRAFDRRQGERPRPLLTKTRSSSKGRQSQNTTEDLQRSLRADERSSHLQHRNIDEGRRDVPTSNPERAPSNTLPSDRRGNANRPLASSRLTTNQRPYADVDGMIDRDVTSRDHQYPQEQRSNGRDGHLTSRALANAKTEGRYLVDGRQAVERQHARIDQPMFQSDRSPASGGRQSAPNARPHLAHDQPGNQHNRISADARASTNVDRSHLNSQPHVASELRQLKESRPYRAGDHLHQKGDQRPLKENDERRHPKDIGSHSNDNRLCLTDDRRLPNNARPFARDVVSNAKDDRLHVREGWPSAKEDRTYAKDGRSSEDDRSFVRGNRHFERERHPPSRVDRPHVPPDTRAVKKDRFPARDSQLHSREDRYTNGSERSHTQPLPRDDHRAFSAAHRRNIERDHRITNSIIKSPMHRATHYGNLAVRARGRSRSRSPLRRREPQKGNSARRQPIYERTYRRGRSFSRNGPADNLSSTSDVGDNISSKKSPSPHRAESTMVSLDVPSPSRSFSCSRSPSPALAHVGAVDFDEEEDYDVPQSCTHAGARSEPSQDVDMEGLDKDQTSKSTEAEIEEGVQSSGESRSTEPDARQNASSVDGEKDHQQSHPITTKSNGEQEDMDIDAADVGDTGVEKSKETPTEDSLPTEIKPDEEREEAADAADELSEEGPRDSPAASDPLNYFVDLLRQSFSKNRSTSGGSAGDNESQRKDASSGSITLNDLKLMLTESLPSVIDGALANADKKSAYDLETTLQSVASIAALSVAIAKRCKDTTLDISTKKCQHEETPTIKPSTLDVGRSTSAPRADAAKHLSSTESTLPVTTGNLDEHMLDRRYRTYKNKVASHVVTTLQPMYHFRTVQWTKDEFKNTSKRLTDQFLDEFLLPDEENPSPPHPSISSIPRDGGSSPILKHRPENSPQSHPQKASMRLPCPSTEQLGDVIKEFVQSKLHLSSPSTTTTMAPRHWV